MAALPVRNTTLLLSNIDYCQGLQLPGPTFQMYPHFLSAQRLLTHFMAKLNLVFNRTQWLKQNERILAAVI